MKKKLLYLLLLTVYIAGYAQVQVGSDTKNLSSTSPIRLAANFSYSQNIYLASEINATGTITSIQFYYNGSSALPNTQNLDIYLGTTSKSSFANDTDWVPAANLTKVYTGGITTGSAPGWITFNLTTPFVYNGTDNLIVAVDENDGKTESGTTGTGFYTTEVVGNRSLVGYSNYSSIDIDPQNPAATQYMGKIPSNFVPNIIFGGLTQSCITPANISFSNITAFSATVSWNDAATHTEGCQYYLSTTKTPPTAATQPTGSVSTIKTIALSGLSPITNYYVWVRNICTTGSYSAWSEMTTFMTGCTTYASFFQNFDGALNPSTTLPYCWSSIVRGTTLGGAGITTLTSGSAGYSGVGALQFSNRSATGIYDLIAVSPQLTNLGSGTMRLKFYARYNGTNITSGSIQIGTLDSPNPTTAVFTPLSGQTINVSGSYVLYTVDLTGYTGSDQYIGIRFANGAASTQILVDDITYEVKPPCADISNVTVTALTTNKVTVSWNPGAQEANWDIAIGNASVTDPSTLTFETTSNTAHTFTTAQTLTPGTAYKVWVRSSCAANQKGNWFGLNNTSNGLPFTTWCTSATTINEDFDTTTVGTLPACWSKILRGISGSTTIQTVANTGIDANGPYSAPNCVSLFDAEATTSNDIILVSPPLSNLGANTNRLRFRLIGKGMSANVPINIQIGTLNTNIANATFTALTSPESLINVTGSSTEYTIDFSSYAGGTNTFIGFKIISSGGGKTAYIDNVFWEPIPTCADVKNVAVSGVTTTVADFIWDVQGTEQLWDVAVGPDSAPDPTGLPITTTDIGVNSAEVTGLQPATSYKVWVRSHCDLVNGKWIGPVRFSTACNAVSTFSEDFNSYTYDAAYPYWLPSCWNKIIRNAAAASSVAFTAYTQGVPPNQTQIKAINIYADNSNSVADVILVCPIVTAVNAPNYRLNLKASASNSIQVGTVNNLTSTATFTKITEFTPNGVASIDLSSYTGTDKYIALRLKTIDGGSSQTAQIDDISWAPNALGTNEFDLSKMNYYPNPVNDILNINCENTIASVSVYNVLGQKVLENAVNNSDAKIDMSTLNPGAYIVKVEAGNQSKTIKIVKD